MTSMAAEGSAEGMACFRKRVAYRFAEAFGMRQRLVSAARLGIVEQQPTLKIFGEEVPLRAEVTVLNGYSAHADRTELTAWLDAVPATSPSLGQVWLVHGEPTAQDALATTLRSKGYQVGCPSPGERGEV